MPSVDYTLWPLGQGDMISLAEQLVHITCNQDIWGLKPTQAVCALPKKLKLNKGYLLKVLQKAHRTQCRGSEMQRQGTARHPLAVASRNKLLNQPVESGPANSWRRFAAHCASGKMYGETSACVSVRYLPWIHSEMSLTPQVCKLPSAGPARTTASHGCFWQVSIFTCFSGIKMQQTQQREPEYGAELLPRSSKGAWSSSWTCPKRCHFWISLWNSKHLQVWSCERQQQRARRGSAVCSVGDDACDTFLRCCGESCGRKAEKYSPWWKKPDKLVKLTS